MPKYECIKDFTCQVCNVKGLLQIISKNYARVRHYTGLDAITGKPSFVYHRQSIEYAKEKLRQASTDQFGQSIIDPNLLNQGFFNQTTRACSSVRTGGLSKLVVEGVILVSTDRAPAS
jgi:hypothetical protein